MTDNQAIAKQAPEANMEKIEKVLIAGDLAVLTAAERVMFYKSVCQSLGLNPLTKPFEFITLNQKMVLYAKKDAADQLRKIHSVSMDSVDIVETADTFIATAKGHDASGRFDVEIGVVKKVELDKNGKPYAVDFANAQMKAVTKAKRRLTLSLCGLGWLDETELETIPNVRIRNFQPETGLLDAVAQPPAGDLVTPEIIRLSDEYGAQEVFAVGGIPQTLEQCAEVERVLSEKRQAEKETAE